MRWLLAPLLALLLVPPPASAGRAADIARAVREAAFDREECYRIRDLILDVEDIHLYLTDGHVLFSKPVAGKRIAAVFTADTDGGDAEVMLLPPNRAERQSLAGYIDSPNLNEHFSTAVMFFTGDVYRKLKEQIDANPANRRSPEVAPLMDEQWGSVLHSLGGSYQTRLTFDLMGAAGRPPDLFAAVLHNETRGNFDLIHDPERPEQILAGRVAIRNQRVFFDIWTSFTARSRRNGAPLPLEPYAAFRDYRIAATVEPDLSMTAVTRLKVTPQSDGLAAVPFDLAPQMTVSEASVDGKPAEVLQYENLRSDLLRDGNELILVVPPEPLRAGRAYEFEIHHAGKVILDAGNRVLYVGARGNWYPTYGAQFANYDLLFRYPRNLDLVTPGEVVEDRTEGEQRVTRRRTTAPIRIAGFNLGDYEHVRLTRGGYEIDVCANRTLESALEPKPSLTTVEIQANTVINRPTDSMAALARSAERRGPDPKGRLQELATEVASALEFMASKFGPPALPHLAVSPIPGTFGQGFPGLIYLSTLSYLETLPGGRRVTEEQKLFYQDLLQAHEAAHQWWGNRIVANAYREDWLTEALANYSALLYLEKSKGPRAFELMLDYLRNELLETGQNGQTVESTGPIVLGTRLENSVEPRGWRIITYDKGSWILQMLRARMGDARFFSMLGELARRYDRKELTTEEFRQVAAEFLPPGSDDPKLELFFEQWVYGVGIPKLSLTYSIKGKAPAYRLEGTLKQSEVDEQFSAEVPIEIQLSRTRTVTKWVRSETGSATFTVPLRERPLKVTLDPHNAVLRRKQN